MPPTATYREWMRRALIRALWTMCAVQCGVAVWLAARWHAAATRPLPEIPEAVSEVAALAEEELKIVGAEIDELRSKAAATDEEARLIEGAHYELVAAPADAVARVLDIGGVFLSGWPPKLDPMIVHALAMSPAEARNVEGACEDFFTSLRELEARAAVAAEPVAGDPTRFVLEVKPDSAALGALYDDLTEQLAAELGENRSRLFDRFARAERYLGLGRGGYRLEVIDSHGELRMKETFFNDARPPGGGALWKINPPDDEARDRFGHVVNFDRFES